MDMPFGFFFSASNRRVAALCASDLCFFVARSLTRCCWTADAVELICFLFGLGFVGAEDADVDVEGGNASLLLVKLDSDGVLSTLTKTTSLWLLFMPPISARRRRTCWRTISSALSDFENPARIMAHGTLTPVVVWRTLGYGVYSVIETDLNCKL